MHHRKTSNALNVYQYTANKNVLQTHYVLFGLPLGLEPLTSYSLHFFTQSVSSFRNTCPYHRNLICCSTKITSSVPSLSVNSLLGNLSLTLTLHIHLTVLISARWNATSFSFLTGQEMLCNIVSENNAQLQFCTILHLFCFRSMVIVERLSQNLLVSQQQ